MAACTLSGELRAVVSAAARSLGDLKALRDELGMRGAARRDTWHRWLVSPDGRQESSRDCVLRRTVLRPGQLSVAISGVPSSVQ